MAILGIQGTFSGYHGTEKVQYNKYLGEITFEGTIINDFVNQIDYDIPTDEIKKLFNCLDNKYLDDIVGRATIENIALYIFFMLRHFPIKWLKIEEENGPYVIIYSSEIEILKYEPQLLLKIGKSKLLRGKYEEALFEFNKALGLDPTYVEAYNCRGRCYKHLKDFDHSLNDFSKALIIDPKFGEAYRNRANIYLELGDYNLMLPDFNQAVKLMPESAVAFNNRGFAYQKLNNFGLAILDHTVAIELDPLYSEAYFDRGNAYTKIGDLKNAEKDYKEAKRLEGFVNRTLIERYKLDYKSVNVT